MSMDSKDFPTQEALRLLDDVIPFRLGLIEKGECVDASLETIRDALRQVRASLFDCALCESIILTIWKDGTHKLWSALDAKYAEKDPEHLCTIPLSAGARIIDEGIDEIILVAQTAEQPALTMSQFIKQDHKDLAILQKRIDRNESTINTIANALSHAEHELTAWRMRAGELENENRRLRLDSHGARVESAPSVTASEGLSEGLAGEPVAFKQLQALTNPYGHCQVSAHAWDMAIAEAMRVVRAAPQPATQGEQEPKLPDVLFDGFAVLQALTESAQKRTSATNVADVLDAVVRLMRANIKGEQA